MCNCENCSNYRPIDDIEKHFKVGAKHGLYTMLEVSDKRIIVNENDFMAYTKTECIRYLKKHK